MLKEEFALSGEIQKRSQVSNIILKNITEKSCDSSDKQVK